MTDYDADPRDELDEDKNDTRILPEKYINNTVIKMEDALASNEPDKIFTYFSLVEHLQDLADALKMISAEEKTQLDAITFPENPDKSSMFKSANKKAKILLKCIFSNGKLEAKLYC